MVNKVLCVNKICNSAQLNVVDPCALHMLHNPLILCYTTGPGQSPGQKQFWCI